MKKLFFLCVLILFIWTSYHDLTTGTLPKAVSKQSVDIKEPSKSSQPHKNVKIGPGDTVLSIVEQLNPQQKTSIKQIMADFKHLNNGVDPNQIQIDKVYAFPLY